MKKTVVLAIFTLQGNGAERFALTLAKGLVDAGHNAHIVYFKPIIDLPVPDGVQLHYFDYRRYRILPKFMRSSMACAAFDRFVMREIGSPDLVLSNLYSVDLILHKSKLPNVHLVIHNTMSEEYRTASAAQLSHLGQIYRAKPCIGVSQGVTDDFLALFGNDSRIQTIYNPIDADSIIADAKAYQPPQQGYIVHVGKFKQQKRHDILIRAYAKSQRLKPLVLVGTGPLLEQSKQLVHELGLEQQIIFAGFQKNPYPWIFQADFMVLSSDFEGLGLVILESIALGTPVISTDCPSGPAEILPPQNLVPVKDIDALAAKIDEACQAPAKFSSDLAKRFGLEFAVGAYLALIDFNDGTNHTI